MSPNSQLIVAQTGSCSPSKFHGIRLPWGSCKPRLPAYSTASKLLQLQGFQLPYTNLSSRQIPSNLGFQLSPAQSQLLQNQAFDPPQHQYCSHSFRYPAHLSIRPALMDLESRLVPMHPYSWPLQWCHDSSLEISTHEPRLPAIPPPDQPMDITLDDSIVPDYSWLPYSRLQVCPSIRQPQWLQSPGLLQETRL